MTAPTIYSEWTYLLEKFGEGDDTSLEEMNRGSFEIDKGTANRFYSRVEDAYKKRKQSWLDKFQRSFQLQNFKSVDDFSIALRNGKQNLYPLLQFVSMKSLPDDLRKILSNDLEDFVDEIKKSLKDNISKVSKDRERIIIILNSLTLKDTNISINVKEKNERSMISPNNGRKIIF